MENLILFRVDGGKVWGISLGHVKRSLVLASALSRAGKVLFIMKNYPDGVEYVKNSGFEVIPIEIENNSDETIIDICEKLEPARLFFDLIKNPYTTIFDYCRGANIQTVVLDSLGNFSGSPDILINDTIVPSLAEYPAISEHTKLFIGPQYFIIAGDIYPVEPKPTVENVLLTMGGSDPAGLTVKILRPIADHFTGYKLNVVLGPLFTEHQKVYEIIKGHRNIVVHENPDNFIGLMSRQDAIITAGGRTLYECAYLGKPVLIIPSIEHEALMAEAYAKATGSCFLPAWEDAVSGHRVSEALNYYSNNYSIRKAIYQSSIKLIDGNGVERILGLLGL